jgi:hypothetical protein
VFFHYFPPTLVGLIRTTFRLKEEIARRKKNQSKRLNKKNAQIVQAGGTPMQLKPETTVRVVLLAFCYSIYADPETVRELRPAWPHECVLVLLR